MENKSTKSLMMLTTDMAMITDKAFKVYSQLYVSTLPPVITAYLTLELILSSYAADEAKFFSDFSDAYAKYVALSQVVDVLR